MATKVTKETNQAEKVAALREAVGKHVETVRDLDGMSDRVARVALVEHGGQIKAVGVGRYALKRSEAELLGELANEVHTLVDYGML